MTNSKLIKCLNLPWSPSSGRPDHLYLWVPEDWNRAELEAEHFKNTGGLGLADWLVKKGAREAVAETWGTC